MVSSAYITSRQKWQRPQALLFSNNPGTFQNNKYIPMGDEGQDFIILSDHNRGAIDMGNQRLEDRRRMINGTMRSYWIADKLTLSTSWENLPSRSYSDQVNFEYMQGNSVEYPGQPFGPDGRPVGGIGALKPSSTIEYTVDGGAGGNDLLMWYEDHPGPFWVFLSYDKLRTGDLINYNKLGIYNHVLQMYFASFDYSIEKRTGSQASMTVNPLNPSEMIPTGVNGFDFWNISMSLEEV